MPELLANLLGQCPAALDRLIQVRFNETNVKPSPRSLLAPLYPVPYRVLPAEP
ncbi:hypothetical protein HDF11_004137 [Tunturiibacter psychrotolerans]